MNYIPYHFSAKSVSRFVPTIRALLEQHRRNGVANIKFNPLVDLNLGLETAIARLRNAVHSISTGITEFDSVDAATLKQVWPLYKITADDSNVMIVPRETLEATPQTSNVSCLATLRTGELGFDQDLTAFARLLSRRHLLGQVDIIGDLSESLQHRIVSENDVIFIPDGQQKYHMI
jgi:hypothetical protein